MSTLRPKTPAQQHEFNLRRFNCYDMAPMDPIYAAAEFITEQARQIQAADARNKILEAEMAVLRADRDRLATKNRALIDHIENHWAEQDANRTALRAIAFDHPRKAAA